MPSSLGGISYFWPGSLIFWTSSSSTSSSSSYSSDLLFFLVGLAAFDFLAFGVGLSFFALAAGVFAFFVALLSYVLNLKTANLRNTQNIFSIQELKQLEVFHKTIIVLKYLLICLCSLSLCSLCYFLALWFFCCFGLLCACCENKLLRNKYKQVNDISQEETNLCL